MSLYPDSKSLICRLEYKLSLDIPVFSGNSDDLRLRNDSEWEPSTGEHRKRCTYQKHCGTVCGPEPLPEGERKVRQVQLALAV
jgi:hypothetical protein